jgi:hypothetical protein
MDNLYQLSVFLRRVTSDIQLRSCHISLYTVLCQAWINNGCRSPFNISRRKVMKLAKIHSKATYHRVMDELITHGYILYNPSYHPANGSEVFLLGG